MTSNINYQTRIKNEQLALRDALKSLTYGNTVNDSEIAQYLADKKKKAANTNA